MQRIVGLCIVGRVAGSPSPPDPPQRSDQPHVADRVRELRPPRRLQVREQIELAAVVGAMAATAERSHAERVPTTAQ